MARIRTVKPELFKHEELFELELETSLPVRLSFIGLFTCCDREGRFKWRPRTLKADIFPYDDIDFSRVLDALTTRGFVVKYRVNDEDFGFIPTFCKHQVINNRESASEIPAPDENSIESTTLTREPRVPDASITRLVQDQGEGKGRERKESARKRAVSLPAEFGISQRVKDWAKEKGFGQLEAHLENFLGYARAKGATYVDWDDAFMNAIRNNWAKLPAHQGSSAPNRWAGLR